MPEKKMKLPKPKAVPKCSFCGTKANEVEKLFDSGNKAMICDECVMNCLEILVYGDQVMEIEIDEIDEGDANAQSDTGC